MSVFKQDFKMTKNNCAVFFAFIFSTFVLIEGKLDIKCINGRVQNITISQYGFGNIYSPGYTEGKPYPNEMFCQLNLKAGKGKYIRLTFNHVDITNNLLCRGDKLSVHDVLEDNKTAVVGQYCGSIHVNDYVSRNNTLVISFQTTFVGTGLGFNITYREVSSRDICRSGEFQCRSRRCIPAADILCNGKDGCGDGTDEENCDYPVPAPTKCGIPDTKPYTGNAMMDRVVGGREAVRGSWPWQVDMQYDFLHPNGHFCGGSLINSEWFITAAHCVQPVRDQAVARIHLGQRFLNFGISRTPFDMIYTPRTPNKSFVNFMKNGTFNMSHDLALVKLNAPVYMNPHIQAVCLPQLNEELTPGERCFATGWGITRGSSSTHVLKQAEHPIQNGTKCHNVFQKFEKETMICAGHLTPRNGLCHGDSGGPLVCKKNEKWHVYGAASFVTDTNFIEGLCGIAERPTVFSKVSAKIQWILSTISNNS